MENTEVKTHSGWRLRQATLITRPSLITKEHLFFVGDVHGKFIHFGEKIKRLSIEDALIIQCGDFGLGFLDEQQDIQELSFLNEICKERNIDLAILRGNHDNPEMFNGTEFRKKLLETTIRNIVTVPDYHVMIYQKYEGADKKAILCVGGAISVDRSARKAGSSCWLDEGFKYDEAIIRERAKFGRQIHIVATHTAPGFLDDWIGSPSSNIVEEYFQYDPTLKEDVKNERIQLSNLFEAIHCITDMRIAHWYHGHFHKHLEREHSFVENDEDKTKFHGLAELEISC